MKRFLNETVEYGSVLHTDGLQLYRIHCPEGMAHLRVQHGEGEYARTEGAFRAHTNTVEGFFSLFKRKLNGTHHAVSKEHLHRYVGEACFHYNTRGLDDGERLETAIQKGDGKRLVYKNTVSEKRAS